MFTAKRHSQHIGFSATPPLLVLRKRFKSSAGASSTPTIDYKALGQQQLDANLTTGAQTAGLNNVNTLSPIWSSVYTPYGTGEGGIGPAGYNLTQTLSDAAQKLYNSQITTGTNATDTAQKSLGSLDTSASGVGSALPTGGLDFTGLNPLPTSASDFGTQTKDAEDSAYNTYTRYLDPKYKEKTSDFNQNMADQGITIGSDAYDRAYGDLAREKSFDYGQAGDQAVTAGQKEQSTLFGENLDSRKQGVSEKEAQYTYPLTALGQLLGDTSGIGSMGNTAWATAAPSATTGYTVPATNVVGAADVGNKSNLNAFASGNALNTSLFNGLGSLGSSSTLWGSGGLSGALGLGNSGLLGGLFGGSGAAAAGAGADAGLLSLAGIPTADSLLAAVPAML